MTDGMWFGYITLSAMLILGGFIAVADSMDLKPWKAFLPAALWLAPLALKIWFAVVLS